MNVQRFLTTYRSEMLALGLAGAMLVASLVVRADDAGTPTFDRQVEENCPGAISRQQASSQAAQKLQTPILKVTRPALQHELVLMADRDQAARNNWDILKDGADSQAARTTAEVDSKNQRRLRQIFNQDGFPTAAMVGYNGVAAAWIVLQHMGNDPKFQGKRPVWAA